MRLQFGTQKVRREWKETAEYTEADYKVIQVDNEVNILQLTDIHYDASNNRKEDTVKLIKQVIENSGADMIALTGDWCYYTPVGKKENARRYSTSLIPTVFPGLRYSATTTLKYF